MNVFNHAFSTPTFLAGGMTVNTVVVLLLFSLVALAYLAVRGVGVQYKVAALSTLFAALAFTLISLNEQLSHPKQLSLFWLQQQGEKGVAIHGTVIKPKDKILLWVDIDSTPRNFWIVWSQALEEELQKALEKWQNGRNGTLRFRFQPSMKEVEPRFYVMPWPKPPEKHEGEPGKRFKFKRQDA